MGGSVVGADPSHGSGFGDVIVCFSLFGVAPGVFHPAPRPETPQKLKVYCLDFLHEKTPGYSRVRGHGDN